MSTMYFDIRDKLSSLTDNVSDESFVTQAFRQYTENLLVPVKKQMAALTEVISGDLSERPDLVESALQSAELTGRELVISATGEVATLAGVLDAVAQSRLDPEATLTEGGVIGTTFALSGFLDNLVDSYQSAEVYNSALMALETASDALKVSAADVKTILDMKGLNLTGKVMSTFVDVVSVLNDGAGTAANKIRALVDLMVKGAQAFDDSTVEGIVIPEHRYDYTGASPIVAFLGGITLPELPTPEQVVSVVTAAARKVVGKLMWLSKQILVGYGKLVTKIDHTLVNPIDFYILNERAKSEMIDVPAVDKVYSLDYLDNWMRYYLYDDSQHIYDELVSMPVGALKATYTPFAIYLLYKQDEESVRLLKHLVPSQPYTKPYISDSDFRYSLIPWYDYDSNGTNIIEYNDAIYCDPSSLFDRWIVQNSPANFDSQADDDPYYLAAVAASVHRSYIIERLSLIELASDSYMYWTGLDTDQTLQHWTNHGPFTPTQGERVARLFGGTISGTHHSAFAKAFTLDFLDVLRGQVPAADATNVKFVQTIQTADDLTDSDVVAILSLMFHNNYYVMEDYYFKTGSYISFIPTAMVSQYPEAKYAIATDGKNGEPIGKILLAIGVAVAVVAGAVVLVKAIGAAKVALTAQAMRLAGWQRAIENLDPQDPTYTAQVRNFLRARRKFKLKNRLLSLVGAGAQTTASSALAESDFFEVPFSNDEVIRLISG